MEYFRSTEGVQLDSANRLFIEQSADIKTEFKRIQSGDITKEFKKLLINCSQVETDAFDFENDPSGARGIINKSVGQKIRQKITELVNTDYIDESTAAVITNAIYFKD